MMRNSKINKGIQHKFAYLKKIIQVDMDKDKQKLLETKLLEAKKDKFAKIYVT